MDGISRGVCDLHVSVYLQSVYKPPISLCVVSGGRLHAVDAVSVRYLVILLVILHVMIL